jgi:hypothetical protein
MRAWKMLISNPPMCPILYSETCHPLDQSEEASSLFIKTAAIREDDHTFFMTIQYTLGYTGDKDHKLVGKIVYMSNYADCENDSFHDHWCSMKRLTIDELEDEALETVGYSNMRDYIKDYGDIPCV